MYKFAAYPNAYTLGNKHEITFFYKYNTFTIQVPSLNENLGVLQ